ncbi:ABC transporter permease [bacterium]|nr:ABC transporter permease [bacterium]
MVPHTLGPVDVLSRIIHGGYTTLSVASLATLFGVLPGLLIGTIAGYWGGIVDSIALIALNSMAALPGLIIALVLLTTFPQSFLTLAFAAGLAQIPLYGHFTRTVIRGLRHRDYIVAAEALGSRRTRILYRHIGYVAAPQLLSYAGVIFSYTMITSTSLSFLGLNGDPAAPEWGAMLAEGRTVLKQMPWMSLGPAVLITGSIFVVHTLSTRLMSPLPARHL